MSLTYIAPDAEPRPAVPSPRPGKLSVAEALRSRFPLGTEPGRAGRPPVAEALRSRFPLRPRSPGEAEPARADGSRPAMSLPWRVRRVPLAAGRAQASASPELLRRVLDGLRRL